MRFRTTIERTGANTCGIPVPPEVLEGLGGGKRPAVTVTVEGYTYRTSVGTVDGRSMVGLSSAHRAASGLSGGEMVDVELVLDTAPRTIEVPADFAVALAAEPAAQATFDRLSYSDKSWHVLQIEGAKAPETRARRVEKSVATLKGGRKR
jgi:hypothetical protein